MIKSEKRLRKKKIEDVKLQIDKIFRGLWMILKFGFFILLIFAAVKIYSYLKKRNPEIAEKMSKGLDENEKHLLRQKYEVLKSQKLSVEEEVIETYNFFLQTMYLIEFPKESWRTASDFHLIVSSEFSSLENCSQVITETFCDTWYGKRVVPDDELIRLREARDQFISQVS